MYRLIHATGRTHNALGENAYRTQYDFKIGANLNDITQMPSYERFYEYDNAGNLHTMQQTGTNPFTRYIKIAQDSNRTLLNKDGDANIIATAAEIADYFDANGNQQKLDHLSGVTWNYRDNIAAATIIERTGDPNDVEYYVYDASGQRSRKVKETWGSGVITVEEKIYLGGIEIKRKRQEGQSNTLERYITHIMDDKQRIALSHHWTIDDNTTEVQDATWIGTNRIHYQYSNHLASAALETDASGNIISYEEYFPYGETSFMFGRTQKEVKLKEYRYTGKERDDSTGLYYHGARYYQPWLFRWMSADPAGPVDGPNLYAYVSGNPVRMNDPGGMKKNATTDSDANKVVETGKGGEVEHSKNNLNDSNTVPGGMASPSLMGFLFDMAGDFLTKKINEIPANLNAAMGEYATQSAKGYLTSGVQEGVLTEKEFEAITGEPLPLTIDTKLKLAWENGSPEDRVKLGVSGASLTPTYIGDWIALGGSTGIMLAEPNWDNFTNLALDVPGAVLPFLPAIGSIRRIDNIADGADAIHDAENVADATITTNKVEQAIVRTVVEIKLSTWHLLRRTGKARGAEHTGVCDRRATKSGGMQRRQGGNFIMITVLRGGRNASEILMDSRTIRFTQESISSKFKDGSTIDSLISALKSGKETSQTVDPIRVFERNGNIFTLDNRRLHAFQEAQQPIRTRLATETELARELEWKFTTKNEGRSIRIRGRK